MTRIIDITLPFSARLPSWPGEGRPEMRRLQSLEAGDGCTVTHLSTCVHFGTHVDAPCHFIQGAAGVDALDLATLIGPAAVVYLPELQAITADDLRAVVPPGTRRLLVKTDNSAQWNEDKPEFKTDYCAFTTDAARWLAGTGIRLVGIDYLSVELFDVPGAPAHTALLGAGVIVLEGLDLRQVDPGTYQLICLPIPIAGADGAPARAVLMPIDESKEADQ